jgi:hypothetical protein
MDEEAFPLLPVRRRDPQPSFGVRRPCSDPTCDICTVPVPPVPKSTAWERRKREEQECPTV